MTDMLKELAEVVRELKSVDGNEGMVVEKMHMLAASGDFLRTHHAEIAQNAEAAKRLMALEMAMRQWWNLCDTDAAVSRSDNAIRWLTKRADKIMRGES